MPAVQEVVFLLMLGKFPVVELLPPMEDKAGMTVLAAEVVWQSCIPILA